jgi:hypothetical protein
MPTFLTPDAELHINTIRTSAPKYMQGYSDMFGRNHVLLSLMKENGMIETNAEGAAWIWQIAVREPQVRVFADNTRKTFSNHDAFEQMQVDVRGYEASDLLTEKQFKLNQGRTQLIKLYDTKMNMLGGSAVRKIQEWMYQDGDSATYSGGFLGFESCLAAGTVAATDIVAKPNDTYGGHSTALGTFGGTWTDTLATPPNANLSNDWPYGQGSSEYDATSPLLVNYTGEPFGTGTNLWKDNAEQCIRFANTIFRSRNGYSNSNGSPLVNLLSVKMYEEAENFYQDRFRIIHPYTMGDMGFSEKTMKLDGSVIVSDYACPAGVGYVLCPEHIEAFFLPVMNGSGDEPWIDVFGPTWSDAHGAYLMRISVHGNMRLQPKFIGKYGAFA